MTKPRIVQFIDNFHRGGTELQTVQLASLLHAAGNFDVRLVCGSAEGPLRAQVEELGLGEIPSFPLTSFYDRNTVTQLLRLRAWLRANDIVLLHTHDFYSNVFAITGSALARVPVRVASRRETNGVRTPAQRFVEKRAFALASMVVANANAVRDQLIDEGLDSNKAITIHNGLDVSRYFRRDDWPAAEWRARFGLPADAAVKLVTIVANLRLPVKDQETFLRAAKQVAASEAHVAFVLAGEGERLETLRALAVELGIAARTFFLGRCTAVAELLALSDICVLSSTAEGFSNAILEYMAAGKPVVATDVGGAAETIVEGETGFLVPPKQPDALAARLITLLQNPALAATMGSTGRKLVTGQFSLEQRLAKTEQLYDRLLREQR